MRKRWQNKENKQKINHIAQVDFEYYLKRLITLWYVLQRLKINLTLGVPNWISV